MGNRLNLGAGYGILLPDDEVKALDPEAVDDRIEAYLGDWIERSYQWSVKSPIDVNIDDGDLSKLTWYLQFIDFDRSKQEGKLVVKGGSVKDVASDSFLRPSEDHGSRSFLGYIHEKHYNEDMYCALLYPLEQLGVNIEYGEAFEYLVPISGMKPLSVENGGDGRPPFVPNPKAISASILVQYAKLLKQADRDGAPLPFQTLDECDEFTSIALKKSDIISVSYQLGLELVQVFYPEKTLRDIERYIVGWWS